MIHKCFVITFEALGQERRVYTEFYDSNTEKEVESLVKKINPTAVITNVCTTVIDCTTYSEKSLEKLQKWAQNIEEYEQQNN
jgi:S-ribosylhomocysteine lyase LuxS involved in autoinducer biosynthesis